MAVYLTTREVAELLVVDIGKVTDWIAAGDLAAVNVAKDSGGARARWRICPQALDAFLAARATRNEAAPARRAASPRDASVTKYF